MSINNIINLIKLLRPKYYNLLTKIMITAALTILIKPLWVDIVNIFFNEFDITLIGENDWVIGLLILILALVYNTIHRYLDLKYEAPNGPAYKIVKQTKFSDFGALCQHILPIIKDNEYIFKNCGPNSGANELGVLRTDLTVWNNLKRESIIPNNQKIRDLIEQNKGLIPTQYQEIFNRLLLHIKAFEEHVKNPFFDYTPYQFPKEITEIIINTCYNYAMNNKRLKRIQKWLSKKIKPLHVEAGFLIGSILLYPQGANDVDIVLLSTANNKTREKIDMLKYDFKIKFRQNLHVTFFESKDNIDYRLFIDKNSIKQAI